jgi:hypothetical protein
VLFDEALKEETKKLKIDDYACFKVKKNYKKRTHFSFILINVL